jgi:RimJ/RimL family protein N-acetyltransferase
VDNLAEQRALERAGFAREGVLRSAQFRDGRFHDLVLYSRLRSDRPSQDRTLGADGASMSYPPGML